MQPTFIYFRLRSEFSLVDSIVKIKSLIKRLLARMCWLLILMTLLVNNNVGLFIVKVFFVIKKLFALSPSIRQESLVELV